LQTIVHKTLGLALPEDLTALDELRHLLWRFLLFSEFAADLPVAMPAALTGVPKAVARYHRFVFDLCATLRDRTSAQPIYEEFSNRVAGELGLETHCGALEDLGVLDTFAFEERCFLRNFAKALLAGDLDKAARFVAERSKSFWIRDGTRAGEWKLASCCVDLLQGVSDLKRVLKDAPPTGVAGWLDFQIRHGYRVDTAHRVMEQVAQDLMPEPGPLADVIARARETHREFTDKVTRQFQDAVVKEGWPVPGQTRAKSTISSCASPGRKAGAWLISGLMRSAMTWPNSSLRRLPAATRLPSPPSAPSCRPSPRLAWPRCCLERARIFKSP
jgi:hypothetical protein